MGVGETVDRVSAVQGESQPVVLSGRGRQQQSIAEGRALAYIGDVVAGGLGGRAGVLPGRVPTTERLLLLLLLLVLLLGLAPGWPLLLPLLLLLSAVVPLRQCVLLLLLHLLCLLRLRGLLLALLLHLLAVLG